MSDLDTQPRLYGFDNITALSLGNGKLALAVCAAGDATTAMTIITSGDYGSPQEFAMDVVGWCRRHDSTHMEKPALVRSIRELQAMRHAQELVS